jgi:hypothetical protein
VTPSTTRLPTSWLTLTALLTLLELIFLYEAMQADFSGYQKIFGIFVGLAILCFAAMLYVVKVVFYDRGD